MARMRNCPFCKKEVNEDNPYTGVEYNKKVEQWIFNHFCHTSSTKLEVCVTVYGDTKEDVIDKWNGVQDEVQEIESL